MATTATFKATYTTAGTFTWIAPAGVSSISVECWAGGGGGGGGGGDGGGGGEYAAELSNTCTPGNSYTVVVGAGGTFNNNGNNSSFTGTGATTVTANKGLTGSVNPGAGGTGSTNSTHHDGGAGASNGTTGGGGGGGSGGTASTGNAGTAGSGSSGGAGAVAVTGGGPGGNGGNNGVVGSAPASGPGGGGGGGGGGQNGGSGFAGQVVITWTMDSPATITKATTGTWTWTAPAGVISVRAECWGSGGGGAGSTNSVRGGAAGGGGEYAAEPSAVVTPGNSYTFTVGAAGTAGAVAGDGGAGGSSTFAANAVTVTANGGSGGVHTGTPGAAGGTGSTNTTHFNGGAGGNAVAASSAGGGGGGGSGGTNSVGNNGGNASGTSAGAAATAVTGGGVGGAGGNGTGPTTGSAPASGPGGGGGGGGVIAATTKAGGAGFDGQLTLTFEVPAGTVTTVPFTPLPPAWLPGLPSALSGVFKTWPPPGYLLPPPIVTCSGSLALQHPGLTGTYTPDGFILPPYGHLPPGFHPGKHPASPEGIPFQPWPGPQHVDPLPITTSGELDFPSPTVGGSAGHGFPFPRGVLAIKVELLVNGTWTDVSQFVFQRDGITITRGRPNEATSVVPSGLSLTFNNRDGRFSYRNPAGPYYPFIGRNTQIRLSTQDDLIFTGPYTYRFWGEVAAWPPLWDPTGTDVYVQIVANGVLRRLAQGSPIGSPLRRYYTRLTDGEAPIAYWTMEDGSGATSFASAVSGGSAMTYTGTPSLSSNTSFLGSDALPSLNATTFDGTTSSFGSSGNDVYSVPGTYTWTAPGGITSVDARAWGGGGGGATGTSNGGGGGGGGELAEETAYAVVPGTGYAVVVGAGGTTGSNGENSSFDGTGVVAHGGHGAGGSSGGTGGTGSSDGNHHNGGAGAAGSTGSTTSRTFTSSGSWTAPAGVTKVTVYAWGGGGGGQSGNHSASEGRPGGGGGEFALQELADVTPGNTYTVTVGAAGQGGASGANPGTNGGDSTFNADSGTVRANGGGGAHDNIRGSGGTGSTATSHHDGGDGGTHPGADNGGSGGGSSGGYTQAGDNGNQPSGTTGGSGGSARSGGGPGGAGGNSGKVGHAPSYGPGGGGGGGSGNSTASYAGGDGQKGKVILYYSVSGTGGGGGGGASGGTAATGSSGSGTSGGVAVTNGGPGGNGGQDGDGSIPFSGPGGGGGGGDGNTTTPYFLGANGYSGQVALIYTPSSVPNANIFRFLLEIPAGGEVDGTVIAQMFTGGTVFRCDVIYRTGGNLQLKGYNSVPAQIFDSGSQVFSANGQPMMVSVELGTSGANVTWKLTAILPGAGSALATFSGSVAGTIGSVTEIKFDPTAALTATTVGHATVQYALVPLTDLADPINGYAGELAGDRITRLCGEEGFAAVITGSSGDTAAMGPQADDTLLNLLQACEDVDRGLLYEPRDSLAIAYRTQTDLTNQTPVILDYSAAVLAQDLVPTADDQQTRNDVTITRTNGSSVRVTLDTGALSTLDPPDGVGRYTYSATVDCFTDSQLTTIADWILSLGTVDDLRYPVINLDLARSEVNAIFADLVGLNVGSFVEITNGPEWLPPGPIDQLALGFTEVLNAYQWTIALNCVPELPYEGGL